MMLAGVNPTPAKQATNQLLGLGDETERDKPHTQRQYKELIK